MLLPDHKAGTLAPSPADARMTEVYVPGLNHALQPTTPAAIGTSPTTTPPDAQANVYAWIMGQK